MRTWEDNAREFGALTKQGKDVRLALLVACSVEKGGKEGVAITTPSGKVTARTFAKTAQTTADRVLRHLTAWDRLAARDLVVGAGALRPNDVATYEVPESAVEAFETPGDEGVYDARRPQHPEQFMRRMLRDEPERAAAIIEDAGPSVQRKISAALPVSPGRVVDALKDPETRTRILSSPEGVAVSLAMGRELGAREPRQAVEAMPEPPAFASLFWRAVGATQAAFDELERTGIAGIRSEPETRLAAERMASQATDVGRAVADYVFNNTDAKEA